MSNDLMIRITRRGGWLGSLSGLLCSAEAVLDLSSAKLSIGEGIHILGQSFPVLAVAAVMGAAVGIGWGRFVAHRLNRIMQSLSEDSSYQTLQKSIWVTLLSIFCGTSLMGGICIGVTVPQSITSKVLSVWMPLCLLILSLESDVRDWYQKRSLPPPS